MAGHDLLHYFLLHEAPCPIADCAFLSGEKFFDAVVIQRGRRHGSSRSTSGGYLSVTILWRLLLGIFRRGCSGEFLEAGIISDRIKHRIQPEQRGSERRVGSQRATGRY